MKELQKGDVGTLQEKYKGYSRVEFVEYTQFKVLVQICDSGKEIEVYPDEVDWD